MGILQRASGKLNPSTLRRFVLTLVTGYLAIYGVRRIPYTFPNEWGVIIPVLIVVYIITTWIDGLVFKDDSQEPGVVNVEKKKSKRVVKSPRGFGD